VDPSPDEGRPSLPVDRVGEDGATRPIAPVVRLAMRELERVQDVVSVLVGATMVVLAVVLLVSAVVKFFQATSNLTLDVSNFLDQVLLVLILVEIVHTVVLSLRSHTLQPEPFIVVGLIAAIRKVLFVFATAQRLSTAQFALYIATAAVFAAALVAVRRWGPEQ
jgi:uncharacterized membrane protein (DUF373 family)